jgi:hypothetical protein
VSAAGELDVAGLAAQLRADGYAVGVDQCLMAQRLLNVLAASGKLEGGEAHLAGYLAPIFCVTPEQQRRFPGQLRRHLGQPAPVAAPPVPLAQPAAPPARRRRWRGRAGAGVLLAALLVLVLRLPRERPPADSALATSSGVETWAKGAAARLKAPAVLIPSVATLLLAGLALAAWRRWKRLPLYLGRRLYRERQRVGVARVQRPERPPLHAPETVRRAAQLLAVHRVEPSADLDARATVERSVANAGVFTPVAGVRRVRVEYLALIERSGPHDPQALLVEELVREVAAQGVFIEHFFYTGDPTICRPADPRSPAVPLVDLYAKHAGSTLLVFSDGRGFVSSVTGGLARWTAQLGQWSTRVLVRPATASRGHDAQLAELGFTFATLADFADVLRSVNNGDRVPYREPAGETFPPLLLQSPRRWAGHQPPPDDELDALKVELFRYLGESQYTLLCACAIYPQLDFELTLFLAREVVAQPPGAAGLQPLFALPWFAQGQMPAWLREALLDDLLPAEDRRAREALQRLLLTALEHPGGDVITLQAVRPRVKRFYAESLRALALRRKREPEAVRDGTRPLYDQVTLSYLLEPQRLSLAAPAGVRGAFGYDAPEIPSLPRLALQAALLRPRAFTAIAADPHGTRKALVLLVLLIAAGAVGSVTTGVLGQAGAAVYGSLRLLVFLAAVFLVGTHFWASTAPSAGVIRGLVLAQAPGVLVVIGVLPGAWVLSIPLTLWQAATTVAAVRAVMRLGTGRAVLTIAIATVAMLVPVVLLYALVLLLRS